MNTNEKKSASSRKRLFAKFDLSLVTQGTWAQLSGSACKVYIALLSRADFKTGKCWPSAETIGKDTGMVRRSVHRALNELVRFGLIDKSNVKGFSNRYQMEPIKGKNVTPPATDLSHPCDTDVPPPVTELSHKLYPKNNNHLTTSQRTTNSSRLKNHVQQDQLSESKRDPVVPPPAWACEKAFVDEPASDPQRRPPQRIGSTILKYMANAERQRQAGTYTPVTRNETASNARRHPAHVHPDDAAKLADLFYQGGSGLRKDVPREQVEQWAAKKLERWPASQIAQVIREYSWPDHPRGFDKMLYRRPTRDQLARRRDVQDHHRRKKLTASLAGLVLHLKHYDPPAGWARSALRFFNITATDLLNLAQNHPNPEELYRRVVERQEYS